MTTEELIKRARICTNTKRSCMRCPYDAFDNCSDLLMQDLADLLKLERKICASQREEISDFTKLATQLEHALNTACKQLERYSNRNTSMKEWKEWCLQNVEQEKPKYEDICTSCKHYDDWGPNRKCLGCEYYFYWEAKDDNT